VVNDRLNMVALVALSVLSCGALVGMVLLEMADKPVPPALIAIGATCVGSLSGFLNPNRAAVFRDGSSAPANGNQPVVNEGGSVTVAIQGKK